METVAIRVFYRKSDNQIVWTHELRSPEGYLGQFPTTVEQDLAEIPDKMPDEITPLGGMPEDYACIPVEDTQVIEEFFASDDNTIVNAHLITGAPRPPPEPDPDTIRAAEILATSPSAITMPEMWELLRIIGRRLGY